MRSSLRRWPSVGGAVIFGPVERRPKHPSRFAGAGAQSRVGMYSISAIFRGSLALALGGGWSGGLFWGFAWGVGIALLGEFGALGNWPPPNRLARRIVKRISG